MELVISTAGAAVSVALIDGDTLVAERHDLIGRGHAEAIVTTVAAVIGERGTSVTGIVVDTGPGSFTGVRIGVAAARALGLAWGVPVVGVGSLALVAAAFFAAGSADTVVAVADAGRGRVYWQAFARAGVRPLGAAQAGLAAEVPAGARADAVARAADARRLPATARGAPLPLYLAAAA